MDLEELLSHTAADYLDDRTDLLDGDPDELWSDALLVRYLNEGQRILARRSWCIIETGLSVASRITLATGKATYALHKSVLRVFDATPDTQVYPVGRTSDAVIRNATNPYDHDAFDIGNAASLAGSASTGSPLAIATDAGTRMLRVYPTPTSTENGVVLTLKVARLPICWLDVSKPTGSPEVPEDYHLLLTTYAAGRCLRQPNVASSGKADGRELLAEFDAAVREARQDRQRAEMDGGRWGFSSTTATP